MSDTLLQLISVISLLSSDTPNLESPANIDAAKEARTEPESMYHPLRPLIVIISYENQHTRRKCDVWFAGVLRKHLINLIMSGFNL